MHSCIYLSYRKYTFTLKEWNALWVKTVCILSMHVAVINTVCRMSDHRTLAWSMITFAF